MYDDFHAADRWSKKQVHVQYQALIVAIATRPFLFAPIGLLCLLVSAKLTAERRFTAPAAGVLALGALAGAAVAVGFTQPLY